MFSPKPRWGVFSGTFDPPHIGHLILADAARIQHELEMVLWLPTPIPPHKQGPNQPHTPWELRLEMLQAAVAGVEGFGVSAIEHERPGPHYSVDTMAALMRRHPNVAEWYFIIGGDSALNLRHWREPERLLRMARLCVVPRPGFDLGALKQVLLAKPPLCAASEAERVVADVVHDAPLIGVSATELRHRVAHKRPIRFLVPPAVAALIERHQLYQ